MLTLIVIVLFGLGFAFLATQNIEVTRFNLLGYVWMLPMYVIVLGALLVGFFISWIVSSISTIGTWFNLHSKDSEIRESRQTVEQLQDKIRELELENAKLLGRDEVSQKEVVAEKPVTEIKPHNLLDRFFRRNTAY